MTMVAALVSAMLLGAGGGVASAQIARMSPLAGASMPLFGAGLIRGTDVDFDPVHNAYLVVGGYGAIWAMFVDTLGNPASAVFTLPTSGFAHKPRVKFSPHINDGQGGFLVAWHMDGGPGGANGIYVAQVAYPNGLLAFPQLVSDFIPAGSFWEQGPAIAYSTTSQRFLVAWTTLGFSVQARLVHANGTILGTVIPVDSGAQFPSVAWNAVTDEFGIGYTGFTCCGAFASFRRVNIDGGVNARESFGFSTGTFATGVDVNTATGGYLMTWWAGATNGILIHPNGTPLAMGMVTNAHAGQDNLGLAYNPASGTFLVGGSFAGDLPEPAVVAVELNGRQALTSGRFIHALPPARMRPSGTSPSLPITRRC
jgi:hypothetical protein